MVVINSLLLRVFFETADGGYYSPFINGCFEVLPIPEFVGRLRDFNIASKFSYSRIPCRCSDDYLSKYLPIDYVLVSGFSCSVNNVVAHWDPRFDIGVYSDYWRHAGGRIPKVLTEYKGDKYLFFAAGLAHYPKNFFSRPKGFTEIRRMFMRVNRGIYVVGYMRIDEIVDLTKIAKDKGIEISKDNCTKVWEYVCSEVDERICETPHYIRPMDLPVVILSEDYCLFKKPIPIMLWVNNKKLLTNYSYTFGVRGFSDRIRQKVFTPEETKQILKLLDSEDVLP